MTSPKWVLAGTGALLVALALWGAVAALEWRGAMRERLKLATAAHTLAVVEQRAAAVDALLARQEADSVRAMYRREQARDHAVAAATDSATRYLASARDAALAVARDSGATASQLRATVERLVTASDSAEAAHTRERAVLRAALTNAEAVIASDSVAIQRGVAAENAALRRATTSEAEVVLLKQSRPSTFWRVAERVGWAGVTVYLAAK